MPRSESFTFKTDIAKIHPDNIGLFVFYIFCFQVIFAIKPREAVKAK